MSRERFVSRPIEEDQGGGGRLIPRSVMKPPQWQPWRRPPSPTPTPLPVPPKKVDGGRRKCDGSRECRGHSGGKVIYATDSFIWVPSLRLTVDAFYRVIGRSLSPFTHSVADMLHFINSKYSYE